MSRPRTKKDLIESSNYNFRYLLDLLDNISTQGISQYFSFPKEFNTKEKHWIRDKNIKDVLIHLYEWHILLLDWIESNVEGKQKSFLPNGYNWKTYYNMNVMFRDKHINTSLEVALDLLVCSHDKVMNLIGKFSDEELFTNRYYNWTGTTSLGSYCVSSTTSHYDWAIKKIKRHIKIISKIKKNDK